MEEMNPYLVLRAEKIARNEARLKELGLLQLTTTTFAPEKKSKQHKKSEQPKILPILPLRRSSRHTSHPNTYLEQAEAKRRKPAKKEEGVTTNANVAETPVKVKDLSAHSARGMDMNVNELNSLFGVMMARTGKAFVMEECAQLCSHRGGKISFNKYSGVQELKNAMFLWVNLGNGGNVINEFLDGGRKITWFGGSRMHDESNVIRRLLRVGQAAANGSLAPQDGLVLWCRLHDEAKRTFTPYVCLGRLSYHSHEPGSRPLKFVWNLMDYNVLAHHENESVQSLFQKLINS